MAKTYTEKLKDPRWQRKRLEIMQAANFTCENCRDETTTLHVHHRIYRKRREPWEYERRDLACICEACHEYETIARAALAEALITLDAGEIERITGYADGFGLHRAWHYEQPTSDVTIESTGYSIGIAEALGVEWIDLMRLIDSETRTVSANDLKAISEAAHQRRLVEMKGASKG